MGIAAIRRHVIAVLRQHPAVTLRSLQNLTEASSIAEIQHILQPYLSDESLRGVMESLRAFLDTPQTTSRRNRPLSGVPVIDVPLPLMGGEDTNQNRVITLFNDTPPLQNLVAIEKQKLDLVNEDDLVARASGAIRVVCLNKLVKDRTYTQEALNQDLIKALLSNYYLQGAVRYDLQNKGVVKGLDHLARLKIMKQRWNTCQEICQRLRIDQAGLLGDEPGAFTEIILPAGQVIDPPRDFHSQADFEQGIKIDIASTADAIAECIQDEGNSRLASTSIDDLQAMAMQYLYLSVKLPLKYRNENRLPEYGHALAGAFLSKIETHLNAGQQQSWLSAAHQEMRAIYQSPALKGYLPHSHASYNVAGFISGSSAQRQAPTAPLKNTYFFVTETGELWFYSRLGHATPLLKQDSQLALQNLGETVPATVVNEVKLQAKLQLLQEALSLLRKGGVSQLTGSQKTVLNAWKMYIDKIDWRTAAAPPLFTLFSDACPVTDVAIDNFSVINTTLGYQALMGILNENNLHFPKNSLGMGIYFILSHGSAEQRQALTGFLTSRLINCDNASDVEPWRNQLSNLTLVHKQFLLLPAMLDNEAKIRDFLANATVSEGLKEQAYDHLAKLSAVLITLNVLQQKLDRNVNDARIYLPEIQELIEIYGSVKGFFEAHEAFSSIVPAMQFVCQGFVKQLIDKTHCVSDLSPLIKAAKANNSGVWGDEIRAHLSHKIATELSQPMSDLYPSNYSDFIATYFFDETELDYSKSALKKDLKKKTIANYRQLAAQHYIGEVFSHSPNFVKAIDGLRLLPEPYIAQNMTKIVQAICSRFDQLFDTNYQLVRDSEGTAQLIAVKPSLIDHLMCLQSWLVGKSIPEVVQDGLSQAILSKIEQVCVEINKEADGQNFEDINQVLTTLASLTGFFDPGFRPQLAERLCLAIEKRFQYAVKAYHLAEDDPECVDYIYGADEQGFCLAIDTYLNDATERFILTYGSLETISRYRQTQQTIASGLLKFYFSPESRGETRGGQPDYAKASLPVLEKLSTCIYRPIPTATALRTPDRPKRLSNKVATPLTAPPSPEISSAKTAVTVGDAATVYDPLRLFHDAILRNVVDFDITDEAIGKNVGRILHCLREYVTLRLADQANGSVASVREALSMLQGRMASSSFDTGGFSSIAQMMRASSISPYFGESFIEKLNHTLLGKFAIKVVLNKIELTIQRAQSEMDSDLEASVSNRVAGLSKGLNTNLTSYLGLLDEYPECRGSARLLIDNLLNKFKDVIHGDRQAYLTEIQMCVTQYASIQQQEVYRQQQISIKVPVVSTTVPSHKTSPSPVGGTKFTTGSPDTLENRLPNDSAVFSPIHGDGEILHAVSVNAVSGISVNRELFAGEDEVEVINPLGVGLAAVVHDDDKEALLAHLQRFQTALQHYQQELQGEWRFSLPYIADDKRKPAVKELLAQCKAAIDAVTDNDVIRAADTAKRFFDTVETERSKITNGSKSRLLRVLNEADCSLVMVGEGEDLAEKVKACSTLFVYAGVRQPNGSAIVQLYKAGQLESEDKAFLELSVKTLKTFRVDRHAINFLSYQQRRAIDPNYESKQNTAANYTKDQVQTSPWWKKAAASRTFLSDQMASHIVSFVSSTAAELQSEAIKVYSPELVGMQQQLIIRLATFKTAINDVLRSYDGYLWGEKSSKPARSATVAMLSQQIDAISAQLHYQFTTIAEFEQVAKTVKALFGAVDREIDARSSDRSPLKQALQSPAAKRCREAVNQWVVGRWAEPTGLNELAAFAGSREDLEKRLETCSLYSLAEVRSPDTNLMNSLWDNLDAKEIGLIQTHLLLNKDFSWDNSPQPYASWAIKCRALKVAIDSQCPAPMVQNVTIDTNRVRANSTDLMDLLNKMHVAFSLIKDEGVGANADSQRDTVRASLAAFSRGFADDLKIHLVHNNFSWPPNSANVTLEVRCEALNRAIKAHKVWWNDDGRSFAELGNLLVAIESAIPPIVESTGQAEAKHRGAVAEQLVHISRQWLERYLMAHAYQWPVDPRMANLSLAQKLSCLGKALACSLTEFDYAATNALKALFDQAKSALQSLGDTAAAQTEASIVQAQLAAVREKWLISHLAMNAFSFPLAATYNEGEKFELLQQAIIARESMLGSDAQKLQDVYAAHQALLAFGVNRGRQQEQARALEQQGQVLFVKNCLVDNLASIDDHAFDSLNDRFFWAWLKAAVSPKGSALQENIQKRVRNAYDDLWSFLLKVKVKADARRAMENQLRVIHGPLNSGVQADQTAIFQELNRLGAMWVKAHLLDKEFNFPIDRRAISIEAGLKGLSQALTEEIKRLSDSEILGVVYQEARSAEMAKREVRLLNIQKYLNQFSAEELASFPALQNEIAQQQHTLAVAWVKTYLSEGDFVLSINRQAISIEAVLVGLSQALTEEIKRLSDSKILGVIYQEARSAEMAKREVRLLNIQKYLNQFSAEELASFPALQNEIAQQRRTLAATTVLAAMKVGFKQYDAAFDDVMESDAFDLSSCLEAYQRYLVESESNDEDRKKTCLLLILSNKGYPDVDSSMNLTVLKQYTGDLVGVIARRRESPGEFDIQSMKLVTLALKLGCDLSVADLSFFLTCVDYRTDQFDIGFPTAKRLLDRLLADLATADLVNPSKIIEQLRVLSHANPKVKAYLLDQKHEIHWQAIITRQLISFDLSQDSIEFLYTLVQQHGNEDQKRHPWITGFAESQANDNCMQALWAEKITPEQQQAINSFNETSLQRHYLFMFNKAFARLKLSDSADIQMNIQVLGRAIPTGWLHVSQILVQAGPTQEMFFESGVIRELLPWVLVLANLPEATSSKKTVMSHSPMSFSDGGRSSTAMTEVSFRNTGASLAGSDSTVDMMRESRNSSPFDLGNKALASEDPFADRKAVIVTLLTAAFAHSNLDQVSRSLMLKQAVAILHGISSVLEGGLLQNDVFITALQSIFTGGNRERISLLSVVPEAGPIIIAVLRKLDNQADQEGTSDDDTVDYAMGEDFEAEAPPLTPLTLVINSLIDECTAGQLEISSVRGKLDEMLSIIAAIIIDLKNPDRPRQLAHHFLPPLDIKAEGMATLSIKDKKTLLFQIEKILHGVSALSLTPILFHLKRVIAEPTSTSVEEMKNAIVTYNCQPLKAEILRASKTMHKQFHSSVIDHIDSQKERLEQQITCDKDKLYKFATLPERYQVQQLQDLDFVRIRNSKGLFTFHRVICDERGSYSLKPLKNGVFAQCWPNQEAAPLSGAAIALHIGIYPEEVACIEAVIERFVKNKSITKDTDQTKLSYLLMVVCLSKRMQDSAFTTQNFKDHMQHWLTQLQLDCPSSKHFAKYFANAQLKIVQAIGYYDFMPRDTIENSLTELANSFKAGRGTYLRSPSCVGASAVVKSGGGLISYNSGSSGGFSRANSMVGNMDVSNHK